MYNYKDGTAYTADYQAAIYGLGGDNEWTNLIVSDSLYADYSAIFCDIYSELAEAIAMYQQELQEISSQSIVSGDLHDALIDFANLFNSLSKKLNLAGSSYKSLCSRFIIDVEEADEDMYEAGCDPRDYSNERIGYFIGLIEDTKTAFGRWLDNLINNIFEGLKQLFFSLTQKNKAGITAPDAKYAKEYRQAILDKLNYDKKDIRLIQEREIALDRKYETKFGALYDSLMKIKHIIDKANAIISGNFCKNEISSLLLLANEIEIDSNSEITNADITVDNVEQFCSTEGNRDIFIDDYNELENVRNTLGVEEAIYSALTTGIDSTKLEIFRGEIPEQIASSERYSYLLLKKQLAETVAEMAGNPPNISEYEKEQLYNYVNKALNGDTSDIPDQYKNFIDRLIKMIRKNSKVANFVLDGFEEAILPLFYDYTANLKVIESLGNGVDPNSNLGIAVDQLKQEYSQKFITGFNHIIDYAEKQIATGIEKTVSNIVKDALKTCGVDIDLYLMMTEKAKELSGIDTIGNASEKIYALHESNKELLQAYQTNYDIIARGNYTEVDVENLKNSFTLLKETYIEEYRAAAELAGAEGNHELKRQYKERIQYLKTMSMGDYLPES